LFHIHQPALNIKGEINMRVVLYGATGKAGSVILKELVDRGHSVTAVARTPEKVQKFKNVSVVQSDLSDPAKVARIVKGADAVVSAYGPPPDKTTEIIAATDCLVQGIEQAGGPRLIVVGGAGSLFVAPGVTVRESGHLPKELIPIVDAHIQVLRNLKQSSINWTYFSPAGFFEPGERTGKFRLGKDDLITDAQANSRISFEDYAIALVDELENPQHQRERFTVGY
jgi:putative NADH-flavin reductase